MSERPHAVVITNEDPWARSFGGTMRIAALSEALARAGARTSVLCPGSSDAPPDLGLPRLEVFRVPVAMAGDVHRDRPARRLKRRLFPMPFRMGARNPAIDELLDGLGRPDVLVLSSLNLTPYAVRSGAKVLWLDHADAWGLVAERERADRRGLPRVTAGMQARRVAHAEREWTTAAKVATAAGWSDAAYLEATCARQVVWLPTPVSVARARRPGTDRRRTAGMFANFDYRPNLDALVALERWTPELRRQGWRILVAGFGSDRVPLPPDVESLGPVASAADFYDAVDLSLAPLRLGGGIKVKVIESLLYGVPVLATPFAVDGLPPELRSRIVLSAPDAIPPDLTDLPKPVDEGLDVFRRHHFDASVADLLSTAVKGAPVTLGLTAAGPDARLE
jgi:glycosyltransferase involved in cell wall biosynthesis